MFIRTSRLAPLNFNLFLRVTPLLSMGAFLHRSQQSRLPDARSRVRPGRQAKGQFLRYH
jgi:hypothetical protein